MKLFDNFFGKVVLAVLVLLVVTGILLPGVQATVEWATINQNLTLEHAREYWESQGYVAYASPDGTLYVYSVEPNADNTYDLGTALLRFQDIYGVDVYVDGVLYVGSRTISDNGTQLKVDDTYISAPGTPDYVVGVNTATDDVPGSTGYWVKSGSTGQMIYSTSANATDGVIAAIYSDMPSVTTITPGTGTLVIGKMGSIQFGVGRFTFTSQWTVPAGYQISLIGDVSGSYGSPTVVSALPQPYLGGTEFFFTGTTYPVFNVPQNGEGDCATILNLSNLTFVIANPAEEQANTVYAYLLDGWCAGTLNNIYWLSDVAVYYETGIWDYAHIKGLSIQNSSVHDRLRITSMTVAGFMDYMLTLESSHLKIEMMTLGCGGLAAAGDGTYALRVENEGVMIDRLHLMAVRGGISTSGMSQAVEIGVLSNEGVSGSSLFDGAPINIGYLQIVHPNTFDSSQLSGANIQNVSYANEIGYGGVVNSKQGWGIGGRDTVNQLLPILGDVRGLWPLFDCTNTTTVTDYSPKGHNGVATQNTNAFTTVPLIKGCSVVYSMTPVGSGESVTVADSADFTFGNGSTDSPFSAICYFKPHTFPTQSLLIAKSNEADQIEWSLYVVASGKLYFQLYDNVNGGGLRRLYNTALIADTDYIGTITYDGSANLTGMKIYLNGVRVDDTSEYFGSYTAMTNTTSALGIGCSHVSGHLVDAKMSWAMVTGKELSTNEVWNVTQILKSALQIP